MDPEPIITDGKVYVISRGVGKDRYIVGIFTTLEKANEAMKLYHSIGYDWDWNKVQEFILDHAEVK